MEISLVSPVCSILKSRATTLLVILFGLLISGSLSAQQRIVGYYAAYKASTLPYNNVEYSNLTDINVAFAYPNANGSLGYIDPGMPFPQLVSAAHAAGVKVLISLGGAANSTFFPDVTADSSGRATFINNIVLFLTTNNYDGVDIDWETPTNTQQTAQLTALVREMRARFNQVQPAWLITMAVPATSYGGQHFDYASLTPNVDWYNVMCYDFVGSWVQYAGHDSPLYQASNDPNRAGSDSTAIYYNISRGIPKNKLVLGVPFYGDVFAAAGLYQKGTWTGNTIYSGVMSYIASGWTYHWDSVSAVPYLTNPGSTQFLTFEDTNSVRLKTEFSVRQGLGGIMIWELSQDLYDGRQPLLETIANATRELTGVQASPITVRSFRLYDNYPNPFNPTTAIRYRLPAVSYVTLKVYDVLGRQVAVLVNARQNPGTYAATFDGIGLASGVYFYRLEAGANAAVGKMVLLK